MRTLCFAAARCLCMLAVLSALATAIVQAQTSPVRALSARVEVAEVALQGCLQRGAERTTLTDETGTTYLLDHAPVSSPAAAFVEVHGEQLSPAGQRGEAALPEVRVTSMRRLSDACPQKLIRPPSSVNPPLPGAQSPSTPPYQSPIAPQPQDAAPVLNTQGAGGAPSPGTGNPPDPQPGKKQ
jgi:putative hemolysin